METVRQLDDARRRSKPAARWWQVASLLLLALTLCADASAQDAPETSEPTPEASSDPTTDSPPENEQDPFVEPKPCNLTPGEDHKFLDKTRFMIFEAVCRSGRWFDNFFGDEPYWRSAQRTWGRIGVRLIGDEREGLDSNLTLDVNLPLPNLEKKANLFLRREEEDEFVADPDRSVRLVPALFENRTEREWVIGAGYHPMGGATKGLDFDAGMELRTPLEPYVRGRYRHYWLLGEHFLMRTRPAIYWRNQHGLGTSLALDMERNLGESFLLRFSNFGGIDEIT